MANFPVKYFDSNTFASPPRCAGVAGDLIKLLQACLIDGFNVLSVQSMAVAAGVATVEFGTIHGYIVGQIIKINGATPTELNGEQYVTGVTSTALTFTTTAADGPASGTMDCRTAPVGGWEKVYTGTNKAVFRSSDIQGLRHYLRVYDAGATYAQVRGYKTMSTVDAGTAPFPTTTQVGGNGAYIYKSNVSGTTPHAWTLIADSRTVYLAVAWNVNYPALYDMSVFGDAVAYKVGDANMSIIHASMTTQSYPGESNAYALFDNPSYAPVSYSGSGTAVALTKKASALSVYYSGYSTNLTYPSPITDGLLLHSPVILIEGRYPRGHMPGLMQCLQDLPLTHGAIVDGVSGLDTRRVLLCSATAGYVTEGRIAFDVTGPWQ